MERGEAGPVTSQMRRLDCLGILAARLLCCAAALSFAYRHLFGGFDLLPCAPAPHCAALALHLHCNKLLFLAPDAASHNTRPSFITLSFHPTTLFLFLPSLLPPITSPSSPPLAKALPSFAQPLRRRPRIRTRARSVGFAACRLPLFWSLTVHPALCLQSTSPSFFPRFNGDSARSCAMLIQ
jgi:hypothetical protein